MGSQCPGHCTVNIGESSSQLGIDNATRTQYPKAATPSPKSTSPSATAQPVAATSKPATFEAAVAPKPAVSEAAANLKKAINEINLDGIAQKVQEQGGAFKDEKGEELIRKELNVVVSTILAPALQMAQAAGVPKDEVQTLMGELGARIGKLHGTTTPPPSPPQVSPLEQPLIQQKERGRKTRCGCLATPLKWLVPLVLAALCLLASVWLLHVSTHSHAQESRHSPNATSAETQLLTWDGPFGDSDDPTRDRTVAVINMPTGQVLRYLRWCAAILAAAFVLFSVFWQDSLIWSKVMFTNALLALGQGALAAAMVSPVPAACSELVGHEGVWLNHPHSFLQLLGWQWHDDLGQDPLECNQALWAKSSYILALYALGLYELVAARTARWSPRGRRVLLFVLGALLAAQQAVALSYVLTWRLGFSAEIVLTLLAAVLLYTGRPVASASKQWLRLCAVPHDEFRLVRLLNHDDGNPRLACKAEQLRRALIPNSEEQAAVVSTLLKMENTRRRPELSEWDDNP